MNYEKVKASKLSFKGGDPDKKTKKKRKAKEEEEELPKEGWVPVETLEDFAGPVYLITSDRTKCLSVANDNDMKLTFQKVIPKGVSPKGDAILEPDQVNEVFVAQPVASNTIALKTHKSRCISTDKFGLVTAEGEAVGPQEEWIPIFRENGVAFQSAVYEKFLKADPEKGMLRADSDSVGFCEIFTVKCQAARKYANKKKKLEENQRAPEDIEVEFLRNTQTWGMNRLIRPKEETGDLKKAAAEGTLYEAMLDRRAKLKSDKFCK